MIAVHFFQNTIRRFCLLSVVLLIFSALVQAQFKDFNADEVFASANKAYKNSDYDKAVFLYESILNQGNHSAELYFNLGNAYYKKNENGSAIYYYEKALKLSPNDNDIKTNLALAQNANIDLIEALPENKLSNTLRRFSLGLSLDAWAILGWVFAFFMLVSFSIYYFHGKPAIKRLFFNLMPLFFIGIVASIYFGFKHKTYQNEAFGIIIAKEVDIKPEPNLDEETLYLLHEGTKLKIIDQESDFVRFELANGNTGWMEAAAVKKL